MASEVTLKISKEDAVMESAGKALGVIGSAIGITGAIIAMNANPGFKQLTGGIQLPKEAQQYRTGLLVVGGLAAAGVLFLLVKKQVAKQMSTRYA